MKLVARKETIIKAMAVQTDPARMEALYRVLQTGKVDKRILDELKRKSTVE